MITQRDKRISPSYHPFIQNLIRYRFLYILILPALLYFILFSYLPMYGIVIAFQDYKPHLGIEGMFSKAKWVGFQNFIDFFSSYYFTRLMRNTLSISFLKIIFGFPAPIILAILFNEMRSLRLKKTVQTISYLPHFMSWVILAMISPWYIFLMRNFFSGVPISMEEAAELDGCNDIQILFKIILPVSLPVLATIGLFYAVGQWNSWFAPSLYLRSKEQWPMQLIVRDLLTVFDWSKADNVYNMEQLLLNLPTDNVKKAAVFVTTIPVMIFYPFAQKYFVTGLVAGSIKG